MQQHRGAKAATLISYGRIILDAIQQLGNDPSCYRAENLRAFVLARSRRHGRSKAKLVVTAMRMFLRYLSSEGYCRAGLDGAIPTIAHWSLSSLPRYLTPSEVDQVVGTCDPATPGGLRDRAVILLLSRLGLRASDVALLRISDIDWDHATVCVAGKSRRISRLPLPQDVGDALLAYLEQGRPPIQSGRVFFRVRAPWKPIAPSAVTGLVRRAIHRAGIPSPAKGAHVLRHSSAVRMLRDGASLEQIRTILRHRDPETTTIYAKVDTELLQQVTQPWPEVTP
jgi:site-specific recombinase XerD